MTLQVGRSCRCCCSPSVSLNCSDSFEGSEKQGDRKENCALCARVQRARTIDDESCTCAYDEVIAIQSSAAALTLERGDDDTNGLNRGQLGTLGPDDSPGGEVGSPGEQPSLPPQQVAHTDLGWVLLFFFSFGLAHHF